MREFAFPHGGRGEQLVAGDFSEGGGLNLPPRPTISPKKLSLVSKPALIRGSELAVSDVLLRGWLRLLEVRSTLRVLRQLLLHCRRVHGEVFRVDFAG